jgi:CRP-like cAMP-binding protein
MGDILFLREGWAYRYSLLGDGRRQVVNFLVPGDLVGPFTSTAKQFAATLTGSSVCRVSRRDLAHSNRDCPAFSAAVEALIAAEYDLLAERTVSLGRRNAKERMAHLLLELFQRLDRVGLVADDSFELPLTQEMMGDALGLSVVHVNRTLRALREDGLATVGYGRATIHDPEALSVVADSEGIPRRPHQTVAAASPLH